MMNRSVYFSGNVKQEDGTEGIIGEKIGTFFLFLYFVCLIWLFTSH